MKAFSFLLRSSANLRSILFIFDAFVAELDLD